MYGPLPCTGIHVSVVWPRLQLRVRALYTQHPARLIHKPLHTVIGFVAELRSVTFC